MVKVTHTIEKMVQLSGSQTGTVLSHKGDLATPRDLFSCHLRVACYWHLVDRSQGCD